mmetsp:Transcript_42502/g.51592  ORF Transcript_42502/g.51592 Transcript_42502/m.51592 type:complete len:496 (-) Transcript_42502:181-1668(-)|eukprot:CAMPEP_0197851962 /NCGR_PEP_ID=MMETSP1438-20131217/19319_1 /TAXON_ID=1461541 /ORGANISM="Pterosperma sp., Strain CCMP1384" /LENGTH=495 /DNA_ID=CAMNT_0043465773 /DNA_START=250 /DNA_END=1737 /DNA_ORIENTATION=+
MSGDEKAPTKEVEDDKDLDEKGTDKATEAAVDDLSKQTAKLEAKESTEDEPDVEDPTTGKRRELDTQEAQIKTVAAPDVAADSLYVSAKKFEDLSLSPELIKGLYNEMNFNAPSRIQATTLPMILTPPYRNLIAQAHNGSGKTTCFVLGMLSRVDTTLQAPQCMCICPVRELVVQNAKVLERMGKFTNITHCTTAANTADREAPSRRKEKIVDQVIIGTPGTLKNWINYKVLGLEHIRMIVFDEADQMFDSEGFLTDTIRIIKTINSKTKEGLQVLLFSATYSEKVKQFAMNHIKKANKVFVKAEDLSLDVISQHRVDCPKESDKDDVLKNRILPHCDKLGQTIIFVRTKRTAKELHQSLKDAGWTCSTIHGDMQHADRDQVITEFCDGVTKIMIATNVLSRGFDNRTVTLVVNYDMPTTRDNEPDHECYLHRIGRSGRFGSKGAAFNLVYGRSEERILDSIMKHYKRDIAPVQYDDEDAFISVLVSADLASEEA